MRVLHITRQYDPARGGIEIFIKTLIHYLQQQGVQNEVLTLRKIWGESTMAPPISVVDGVPVTRLDSWGPRQYRMARLPEQMLRDADVIHLHSADYLFDACIRSVGTRTPIVLSSHGFYFHTRTLYQVKQWVWKHHTLPELAKIHKVVCVSRQDAGLLEETRPFPNHCVIPNGVAVPETVEPKRAHQWRFLSIARLQVNKRLEDALHLMAFLRDRTDAKLQYTLIGKDNGELGRLQETVRELGIEDLVTFRGEVSEQEKETALREHDFLVSASSYEAFGIAIVEGMSYGLIPICSPIPSSREMVSDGKTGFIIDYRNPTDRERLLTCLTDADVEMTRMSAAAREASLRYSWDKVVAHYLEVYREAVPS